MSFIKPIPQYRCHKVVSALQIAVISKSPRGYVLGFTDQSFAPVEVGTQWMKKCDPVPGSYLVFYEDGYMSCSPKKAFEDGYKPLTDAPKYPSPPELFVVWHESPEAVHRAMWERVAVAEGMTYEQMLSESAMCGLDADGAEVELSPGDEIAAIREQKCWGFCAAGTKTIHAWAAPDVEPDLLVHMLAHEIGHATGISDDDDLLEEMRAEQFGSVAALAFRFYMDYFRGERYSMN